MKELSNYLKIRGFDHRQLSREGDIAIYEQSKAGRVFAYEVIRIQSHQGFTLAGKTFPPAENYPSSEQWGRLGWTCASLARANEKAAQLAASGKSELMATSEIAKPRS